VTLVKTASELQLRLETASTTDAEDELLSRGCTVRDDIKSAAEYFEAVQTYRVLIDRRDAPPLDVKAIRQSIGGFRGTFSKSGPKALQQKSADTLQKTLNEQTRRVERWVKLTWRENFAAAEELLERVNSTGFHGSALALTKARNRASKIERALSLDPVRDCEKLEDYLSVEGLSACIERVSYLVEELQTAIEVIDSEQAAMPQEVKAAMQSAASEDGLPLSEVTPELMAALRSAGVLDDLVVRRS